MLTAKLTYSPLSTNALGTPIETEMNLGHPKNWLEPYVIDTDLVSEVFHANRVSRMSYGVVLHDEKQWDNGLLIMAPYNADAVLYVMNEHGKTVATYTL